MIIIMAIRWYVSYSLSYRQVEELLAERGIFVDHTTIHRWSVEYSPKLLKKFYKLRKRICGSWRMDETYIKVKGEWCYLYGVSLLDGPKPNIFNKEQLDLLFKKLHEDEKI
nr:hypothetical protein GTC16762_31960 [Pigmentibacter ruber]